MPSGADVLRAAAAAGAGEHSAAAGGSGDVPAGDPSGQGLQDGSQAAEGDEEEEMDDDVYMEEHSDDEIQVTTRQQAGTRSRIGRSGPRHGERSPLASPSPASPVPSVGGASGGGRSAAASPQSLGSKSDKGASGSDGRIRPRGNLPPPPSFDGNIKKDPKVFKHWLQKVDSFIEIAKHIIGDEEIGLRLHAALEGDAAEYLEGIPARTFGVPEGWKVLIRVLREKYDEKKMHKVGSAMKAFFKMQIDRNWTLTEAMDHMEKAGRLCKEAGLTLPDEIMTHFFFEHSGSSLERQANILLRTGGDYTWKKVRSAVELLYPLTTVAVRRDRDKGYGGKGGRAAHETQQGWNEPEQNNSEMELEDWLFYEDPIEKIAESDVPDYLPENLARELHEVYATHRENRARLAKAVKARGFYVNKGKGKKASGKGKNKDGGKTAGKSPPKSKGKGGRARGMSLEELKKITTCGDCFEIGHWKGDPQCKGPKKAHEAGNVDASAEHYGDDDGYNDYDYNQYNEYWEAWQDDGNETSEAWVTTQTKVPNQPGYYVTQAMREQKSEVYPHLTREEAEEVIHGVNAIKRKFNKETASSSSEFPEQASHSVTRKPLDVFTATALIQHKVEQRKLKEKAVNHVASAPEAVKDAFKELGLPHPDTKSNTVWDCLNDQSQGAVLDLDEMRIAYMVTKINVLHHDDPLSRELQHQGDHLRSGHLQRSDQVPHPGQDRLCAVPRDVLSNTRLAPTVKPGVAYLTIDTACENTVGGTTQLSIVADILEKKHKVKPIVHQEQESYRFGPGEPRISTQRWHIPIGIGGKAMIIKTSALEDYHHEQNKIPWLAGQDWLRFMAAVVDIAEQKIVLKTIGAEAPLFVDHTGHLVVAVDDFPVSGWPQGKVATRDDYSGVLWFTEKAYTAETHAAADFTPTHIYNPEDDIFCHEDCGELIPCSINGDIWEYNMDTPLLYLRRHFRPRTTRFHPQEVVDGPEPRELQPLRITFKDGFGEPFFDVWDEHVEEDPWTGFTVFVGHDCNPSTRLDVLPCPRRDPGVDIKTMKGWLHVHPKSLKQHGSKRLARSMDPNVKPPELPLNRHDQVFRPSKLEFAGDTVFGPSLQGRDHERRSPARPKSMALGSARAPDDEALVGDGALHHGQQGDSGVQVPSSCTHGLYGGDDAARGSAGRGSATCASTGVDFGKGSDAPCTTPPVPDGAEQVPPSGGAWSSIWQQVWKIPGVHQLWKRVERPGLSSPDHGAHGHDLQDLPRTAGQTRRSGEERSYNTNFFYKILCLLIFLTTNVYGGGLWHQGDNDIYHLENIQGQGQGESRARAPTGEQLGRRGDGGDFRRRGAEGADHMNGNVVEDDDQPSGRQKLKPGQKKRMQNLAREALANSKLHRRLVQQRVQQGRWPRKHFRFDLIEIFGGTSMVSVRGATLWRLKVLQPVDIRFGIDLRQRRSRRWLLNMLDKANPRLALVEYPCTVWSILQSNVNYKDRPEELEQLREADRPFLQLTEKVFESQTKRHGHAVSENPATAASQSQPEILRIRQRYYETTACLCMFGLTGKQGKPMQKRVRFVATHPYFVEELDRQCDHAHEHEKVEGQNTAASACYPPDLADAICRAFWRVVELEDYGTITYDNDKTDIKTAWFVDITKDEDKWRPLLLEAEETLARKVQASIFVAQESELYGKICSLIPWQIMNIQIAHLPKAKRVRPGLEDCHRASILLLNDNTITIETEYLKTAQAPRERFVTPVRVAIFALGYAPGDPGEPRERPEAARQFVPLEDTPELAQMPEDKTLVQQSYGETWFVGPPLTNRQKKLAPTIVKLHKNLGHPTQPDLTRALVQDGSVEPEAIELSRRLKCATCERSRRPKIPRPTSFKVIGAFNSKLCMDFVNVPDAEGKMYQFLHILEPNGSFNIFYPCPTREPGEVFDLLTLLWASWAGFPKHLWVDKDGAFEGTFLEKIRSMGTLVDNPPAEAHWQAGEVEAYNRAFRENATKLIDEMSLVGDQDMKMMACAVSASMNDRVRSSGCSAYQWVFGKNPQIPDDILSPDGKFEALQAMELDDELRRRSQIRAAADEKLAAYRLNEAVRTAILRKSHPMKEEYQPGEIIAFWRAAKYRQGKKGQKGRRIPAAWYRGTVIGPHKGDGSTKQNNYWVTSNGRCILVSKEQMRPAFGTELWPVREHVLKELQENPPDDYYDIRTGEQPPPEDDEVDRIPLFDSDPEPDEGEHPEPLQQAESASGSGEGTDLTTLPATTTRAPGTPVGSLLQPEFKRPRMTPPKRQKTTSEPATSMASGVEVPIPEEPPEQAGLDFNDTSVVEAVSNVAKDYWHFDKERGLLVRHHLRPRRALYDPVRAQDLPVRLDQLSSRRMTVMREKSKQEKVRRDTWASPNSNTPMTAPWTGATVFKLLGPREVHQAQTEWQNPQTMSRKDKKALEKELPWSAIPEEQRDLYRQALVKEWTTWQKYQAVEVLDPACSRHVEENIDPARILAARVCYRDKHAATPWLEIKPKARIVCRGDADPDLLELRRDAPTLTRLGLMLILQLAASGVGWFIVCADITGAFLQGDQSLAKRKEPLFIRQPREGLPGLLPGQLLLVVRGIFGLANSPRLFWRFLRDSLNKLGFVQSTLDKALFIYYEDHKPILVL